jgi:hypothetical protein
MARTRSTTRHKHYVLDEAKIRRAQKLLGTKTETETIERALEEVITERERSRAAWRAHERFLRSGIQIRDVYGVLKSNSADESSSL